VDRNSRLNNNAMKNIIVYMRNEIIKNWCICIYKEVFHNWQSVVWVHCRVMDCDYRRGLDWSSDLLNSYKLIPTLQKSL
jgi:hypothetical protein